MTSPKKLQRIILHFQRYSPVVHAYVPGEPSVRAEMGLRAHHAQSEIPPVNGQVERANGTVMNLVRKGMEDGSDVKLALPNF